MLRLTEWVLSEEEKVVVNIQKFTEIQHPATCLLVLSDF
jgi:hypothetical protein